jgi:AraC-like DNA-binding protein
MNVTFHIPGGQLKDFIEYIAFLGGYEIGNGIAFQRSNQVIIINIGDHFSVSDVYSPGVGNTTVGHAVWINGKQGTPFLLSNKGVTAMYAIGIRLGMLPFVAGLPAMETNDTALSADHWVSMDSSFLREQLMGCADVHAGFGLIEDYLKKLIGRKDLSAFNRIKWLSEVVPVRRVEDICRSLGVSRKKLRSEGLHYFGGAVREIQGILRFNQTLSRIASEDDRTLSTLHSYYDQSHFIRDFKERAGITPLQYRRLCQQFPVIRHTPNFLPMERETFLQFIS